MVSSLNGYIGLQRSGFSSSFLCDLGQGILIVAQLTKSDLPAYLFPFNEQGAAFQTSCLIRAGKALWEVNSFFQSVWQFPGLSLDVQTTASCSLDALNVSLSSLLTSLERHAASELYLDFLLVN